MSFKENFLKLALDSFIDNLLSNIVSLIVNLIAMGLIMWYATNKINEMQAIMLTELQSGKKEVITKIDKVGTAIGKATGNAVEDLKKDKDELKSLGINYLKNKISKND